MSAVAPSSSTTCRWCTSPLQRTRQAVVYCSRRCRQAAWRLRHRRQLSRAGPELPAGARFAYADPPYVGLSAKYYRNESTFAGEVDHRALIQSLVDGGYAGWALSASSRSLRELLPLCPEGARVCAWVKPGGIPSATYGLHSRWEALIVVGGRRLQPGVRDWLQAHAARGWGKLPGRKPVAFCAWLFDCLGLVAGDVLDDLFPGSGMVGRAWRELSARVADAGPRDASSSAAGDGRLLRASLVDGRQAVGARAFATAGGRS